MTKTIAALLLLTSVTAAHSQIASDLVARPSKAPERIAGARELIPGLRPGFNTSPWTPPGVLMLPPGAPSAIAWMVEHTPPVPVIAGELKQDRP